MIRKGACHTPDKIDAAKGQVNQGKIAGFRSKQPRENPCGLHSLRIACVECRHDLGGRQLGRCAGFGGDEGMQPFQPAA